MALKEWQKDIIRVEVGKGLSNRKVAEKAECGEKAVRNLKIKEGLKKDSINSLAKKEVQNIIIANEIKTQKDSLKDSERLAYNEVLLSEVQSRNLSINTSHELMKLISKKASNNSKTVIIKDGLGMGCTSHDTLEVELESSDIKDLTTAYKTLVGDSSLISSEDKKSEPVLFERISSAND